MYNKFKTLFSLSDGNFDPDLLLLPRCFPIAIPPDDPTFRRNCMNFVRSDAAPLLGCGLGPLQQINQVIVTVWPYCYCSINKYLLIV